MQACPRERELRRVPYRREHPLPADDTRSAAKREMGEQCWRSRFCRLPFSRLSILPVHIFPRDRLVFVRVGKVLMMIRSLISLTTVALLAARAVMFFSSARATINSLLKNLDRVPAFRGGAANSRCDNRPIQVILSEAGRYAKRIGPRSRRTPTPPKMRFCSWLLTRAAVYRCDKGLVLNTGFSR